MSSHILTGVIRRYTLIVALAGLAPTIRPRHACGQQTAARPSIDSVARYRYDLERHLFASPQLEIAQRARLAAFLKELEIVRVHATSSARDLLQTLIVMDSVAAETKRHTTYLYLRTQTNTLDRSSAEARSAMEANARAAADAVRAQLQSIDSKRADQFIKERPALAEYRFVISSAHRYVSHAIAPAEIGMFARLAPVASDWPLALYDQAMARIAFGTVQTPAGPLNVHHQRGAIASFPDTAVRREGNRLLWQGYNSQRDLFATAVIGTVRVRNALAMERHFDGAPAESYFRAFFTPAEVVAMIARIRARADVSKRYQRVLDAHARWISTRPRGTPVRRPPLTPDSAGQLITMALAPLGPDYRRELLGVLDPANGRLDLSGGEHRASGGASFGSGAVPSGIYLNRFEGLPADVSRLAHEAGHAVENQFHFVDHVSPAYVNGTANMVGADFVSEAYAQFNELVLADALIKRAGTDADKQMYLVQFIARAMEPFYGAQDAELEQAIYDGVGSGRVTTADDLDSLTRRVDEAYDITGETRPELRARWIPRRLLVEDPVYYFNYMYSGMLALKLFERFSLDRERFAPRYVQLVRAGYRATPTDAFKQSLGIDLADPKLLDDGVAIVEARVAELEALFARQEGR